jgi:hypothetical protein
MVHWWRLAVGDIVVVHIAGVARRGLISQEFSSNMIANERSGQATWLFRHCIRARSVLPTPGNFSFSGRLTITFGMQIVHENHRFTCETKACRMGSN